MKLRELEGIIKDDTTIVLATKDDLLEDGETFDAIVTNKEYENKRVVHIGPHVNADLLIWIDFDAAYVQGHAILG